MTPRTTNFADRAGVLASALCAAHCVSLPLLFAILPALGVAWLDNPWVDRTFLIAALPFALSAHPVGYIRHRKCLPGLLASVGLVGIVLAISIWEGHPAHHYAVALGGLLVATVLTLIFLPALYVAWFRVKEPAAAAA
jgi:hypothetical protein